MEKTIKVSIKGVTPLLQHRFPLAEAQTEPGPRTGVPDWKAEAELSLYKGENGEIYQPSDHIEAALRYAAKSFKIPGKRGATYGKLVGSAITVEPFAIPHKIQSWETDAKAVRVQKARVVRYRPRFDEWELDFTITILDEQLGVDVLKQIIDHAGKYSGLGDFRPQLSGKYGKFIVTSWKEMNGSKSKK